MKKIVSFLLAGAMIFSLTACGNSAQDKTSGTDRSSENIESAGEAENSAISSEAMENNAETDTENMNEDSDRSNILIAYFSLAGEQYNVGVIDEGNTSIIAHMIADRTGGELFEIEAVTPYPDTYDGLFEVSQQEMDENARPEIAGTVDNIEDYDTVFIGYPIWWGDMPMIVYNFLESYDFSGKTVIPFCTHGGSGLSGTESTIEEITGAEMADGFAILGETSQNDRDTALSQVTEWLGEVGYLE